MPNFSTGLNPPWSPLGVKFFINKTFFAFAQVFLFENFPRDNDDLFQECKQVVGGLKQTDNMPSSVRSLTAGA